MWSRKNVAKRTDKKKPEVERKRRTGKKRFMEKKKTQADSFEVLMQKPSKNKKGMLKGIQKGRAQSFQGRSPRKKASDQIEHRQGCKKRGFVRNLITEERKVFARKRPTWKN